MREKEKTEKNESVHPYHEKENAAFSAHLSSTADVSSFSATHTTSSTSLQDREGKNEKISAICNLEDNLNKLDE
jgi:hypothetical protein